MQAKKKNIILFQQGYKQGIQEAKFKQPAPLSQARFRNSQAQKKPPCFQQGGSLCGIYYRLV